MRVETVGFISRVRFPDGKVELSISLKNTHHKLSYEITVDVKSQIITIQSLKTPYWSMIIPMTNCAFIHLGEVDAVSPKTRPTTEEINPAITAQRKRMRPRPAKNL